MPSRLFIRIFLLIIGLLLGAILFNLLDIPAFNSGVVLPVHRSVPYEWGDRFDPDRSQLSTEAGEAY